MVPPLCATLCLPPLKNSATPVKASAKKDPRLSSSAIFTIRWYSSAQFAHPRFNWQTVIHVTKGRGRLEREETRQRHRPALVQRRGYLRVARPCVSGLQRRRHW